MKDVRTSIRTSYWAGAGDTGGMRVETLNLNHWRRKHDTPRKVCGLIRTRYPHGSGGNGDTREKRREFSLTVQDHFTKFNILIWKLSREEKGNLFSQGCCYLVGKSVSRSV